MAADGATVSPIRNKAEDMFGAGAGAVDRMPMLRVGFSGIGAILFDQLKLVMKVPPRFTLSACQSMASEDAFALHSKARAIGVMNAGGWGGPCYISADGPATFMFIEMLLGGDPEEPPVVADRPLSKIERRLAGVFFKKIGGALSLSFAPIAEASFDLETTWADPDFDAIKPRAPMIVARYHMEAPGRSGEINVLVPDATLEAVRRPLATVPVVEGPAQDESWEQLIRNELDRTNVTLMAILDERPSTLGEIASLKVGDVLELDATPHSRVLVETNGDRLMWCELGKSGGAYTLRIDEFVNKEQVLMESVLSA